MLCPLCPNKVAHKISSLIDDIYGLTDMFKCSKCQSIFHIPMSSNPTLTMLQGLNGSGKTTYAESIIKANPNTVRVSKGEAAKTLGLAYVTYWNAHNKARVLHERDTKIIELLKSKKSVICDDTNLDSLHSHRLKEIASENGATFKIVFLNTPVEECIRRDNLRVGFEHTGERVIREMAERFKITGKSLEVGKETTDPIPEAHSSTSTTSTPIVLPPPEEVPLKTPDTFSQEKVFEKVEPNESLMGVILCDLDAISCLGERDPDDFSRAHLDKVNVPVKKILMAMHKYMNYQIVYLTNREGKHRPPTLRFLAANFCPLGPILMRVDGDMRKEWMVKGDLFNTYIRDKYNPAFVINSDDKMGIFWKSIGLHVLRVS